MYGCLAAVSLSSRAPTEAAVAPQQREQRAGHALLKPLNFRISAYFRRSFKTYVASHDLKLNELLVRFKSSRSISGEPNRICWRKRFEISFPSKKPRARSVDSAGAGRGVSVPAAQFRNLPRLLVRPTPPAATLSSVNCPCGPSTRTALGRQTSLLTPFTSAPSISSSVLSRGCAELEIYLVSCPRRVFNSAFRSSISFFCS
jgi:hypothetical protein